MAREMLEVLENEGERYAASDAKIEEIVALGQAISDPIRVRMLGMLGAAASEGRACCGLPESGAPAGEQETGICACEFVQHYGLAQSKVSYHLGKLKAAGLVQEEKRGKWSFYSLQPNAVGESLTETARYLGIPVNKS